MINAILTGIFNVIISLVQVLLAPIDILITNYLPDLANALTAVNEFLILVTSSIGWVLSCLGIPGTVISLLVIYYTFKLTVPYLVHLIKLALKWYNTLKL